MTHRSRILQLAGRRAVLTVDGNAARLRRTLAILIEAGWDAYGALDAVEACALLRIYTPGVIILGPQVALSGIIVDQAMKLRDVRLVELAADGSVLMVPRKRR